MNDLPKITIKQEKFARQYVGPCDGNASEAYRKVYSVEKMSDKAVQVEASRLLSHPGVSLWVDNLKAAYHDQEAITVEEICEKLRHIHAGATAAGQWSAASQAAMGLAKLGGLLVEKRQVSIDDEGAHLEAVEALADAPRKDDDEPKIEPHIVDEAADEQQERVTH